MKYLPSVVALNLGIGAFAFSSYSSLAGLSEREVEAIIPTLSYSPPENPPAPLEDTSAKLVNDAAHPFVAPLPTDQRGPCPGLNTLVWDLEVSDHA